MSASASSSLESLIHSLIPQSRNDKVLFNDILAHCRDVLSRLVYCSLDPLRVLGRRDHFEISSHIGQSREKDIGHLTEIIKRRRAHIHLFHTPLPNTHIVSVNQSHPDGAASLQFSNLMSRLLEQVPLFLRGCEASY